jgi:hypothetical protein
VGATVLAALLLANTARATESGTMVLPPEAGAFFQHLLPASPLTDGLDIELRFDHALYRFRKGEAQVDVRLSHPSTCEAPDGPLCLTVVAAEGPGADTLATEARTTLGAALRQSTDGPTWLMRMPQGGNVGHDEGRASAFGGPVEHWRSVAKALYVVLLGAVVVGLWRSRRAILSRSALVPLGLTGLALGLRFLAHAGPADIRAVLTSVGTRRAGWDAMLDLLYAVFPAGDETVWNLNRVVGALSVPLLYLVVRRRFADPIVAIGAGAALAVTPLLVRYSASDTPYILLCAAFLAAVVAYDAYAETAAIGAWILALGLLSAAMQLRPDGLWLIVPALLLTVGVRRPLMSTSARAAAIAFVALNAAPAAWAISGHSEGHDLGRHFVLVGSLLGSPWADRAATPLMLATLVVCGAVAVLYGRHRAEILWLVAVAIALPGNTPATGAYGEFGGRWGAAYAVPMDVPVVGDAVAFHQYANGRYHIPAMYLACGLVGAGAAGVLGLVALLMRRKVPASGLLAVGLVCGAALPRIDVLTRLWTPQREFEFFRAGVANLDPACRIATLSDVMDAGFVPFDYLAPHRIVDLAELMASPTLDGCVVYYRSGNCFTLDLVPREEWSDFRMHPRCRAVEDRFQLEPIVEARVPALAFRGEMYARDPIPLGFYRLRERR